MIALPRHHTVNDLRGGRIGTSSLTEGTRHVAERILAAYGLTYPADYDFALEGSHVERWKALQAGTIDAALQMIPYDVEAGFTDLGPVTEEFALNSVCVAIGPERAWLSSFLQALAEAAQWFRGHVEESAAVAAARTSIEPRYALLACQALAADGVIPRDLRSSPGALAAVTAALRSSGLIPAEGPEPIAAAVDYSYLLWTRTMWPWWAAARSACGSRPNFTAGEYARSCSNGARIGRRIPRRSRSTRAPWSSSRCAGWWTAGWPRALRCRPRTSRC